jgi:ABC-2 type transport system permease protein
MQSFNYYGTYILTQREIRRFLKVYHQTIIAPAVSAMIFLSIFVLAAHRPDAMIGEIKFIDFMGYGLIIMTIVQNAFANSSSSLIMSKVIGYVNDILMPPFTGLEFVVAYSIGSVLRGLSSGLMLFIFLTPFIDLQAAHPGLLVFFTLGSCLLMGMLGILAGIASNSFEQYSAITAYLVTPLSFLSGTFYSVTKLPMIFQVINNFNPFFYMIDGFRYSITGHSDGDITLGIWVVLICNVMLFALVVRLFDRGWKLRG